MLRKLMLATLFTAFLAPMPALAGKEFTDPEPVPVPAKLSAADVEKVVKVSLVERDWSVKDVGSGKKEALYARKDYSVKILVTYNAKQIAIKYLDSTNLDYEEKDGKRYIHKNYNRWIGNLVKDFTARLTQAEFSK